MKFSQRKGLNPILSDIQIGSMNETLRNSLWSMLSIFIFDQPEGFPYSMIVGNKKIFSLGRYLYINYFKKPVDLILNDPRYITNEIREYFFNSTWYETYDLLEYIFGFFEDSELIPKLEEAINRILEKELSGYRFVKGQCTDIIDKEEIGEVSEVLEDNQFIGSKKHIKRALELLYDREKPDYRNSIKESISAVESIAKVITKKPKATLGDVLPYLEKEKKLHPAMKDALSKLYGYTSDEEGIRHSLLDESNLSHADAKFFLISCSAFINYLKANAE